MKERWLRLVRRTIWGMLLTLAVSAWVGFLATVTAQQQVRQSHEEIATEVAVDSNRIATLESSQAQVVARMDGIDRKIDAMSDRLSVMTGVGSGFITVLTLISGFGVSLQIRNRKPD